MYKVLITSLILCVFDTLNGQDLSSINIKKPLSFDGGNIGMGMSFYQTNALKNRQSPFAYYINGSASFTIAGIINIPASFSLLDQKASLSSPFNRLGFTPSYKWIKLHLGHSNMTFTSYTLAGQTFVGSGLELTPKRFRLSMMYGRMLNPLAQIDTLVGGAIRIDKYNRMAYGGKLGGRIIERRNLEFDINATVFKAKDEPTSNPLPINSNSVLAAENIVIGADTRMTLFKILQFNINAAASAYTNNTNAKSISFDYGIDYDFKNFIKALPMTKNLSTRLSLAGDAGIDVNLNNFTIGVNYNRVEPGYTSLGALYFQDDFENYTLKTFFNIKNTFVFNGNLGFQQNNLLNLRSIKTLRRIGNMSLSLTPNAYFSMSANYSNFNFNQTPGIVSVNDTFRLAQTTSALSIMPVFNFKNKINQQSIALMVNRNVVNDLNNLNPLPQNAIIEQGSVSYNLSNKTKGFGVNSNLNYTANLIGDINSVRYSAGIGVNKSLLKKALSLRWNMNYGLDQQNGKDDGNTLSSNLSIRYKILKTHNLSANLFFINRNKKVTNNSFSEWRGSINYSFTIPSISKTTK